jgi:hypothetical protein
MVSIPPFTLKATQTRQPWPHHAVIRPIHASGRCNYRMNWQRPHVYAVDPPPEHSSMRSFDDDAGSHWQAALLEASFGNVLVIFSRIGGDGALHAPLHSANLHEAEQLLADADEAQLRTWLAGAKAWP